MTEFKLENGDLALTPSGAGVRLRDSAALVQCAKNALNIRQGSFIYDRTLGGRPEGLQNSDPAHTRQAAAEALARFEDVNFEVLSSGESTIIRLSSGGCAETAEVRYYGDI